MVSDILWSGQRDPVRAAHSEPLVLAISCQIAWRGIVLEYRLAQPREELKLRRSEDIRATASQAKRGRAAVRVVLIEIKVLLIHYFLAGIQRRPATFLLQDHGPLQDFLA